MNEYTLVSSLNQMSDSNKYILVSPSLNYVGFIGYLWQVVRAIAKYPNRKYYIKIGDVNNNVWDFYFKQPFTNIPPDPQDVQLEVGLLFDEDLEFVDLYPCMKRLPEEVKIARKNKFASIIRQYFQLHEHLQDQIETFKRKNFQGKKILGFHHRGTDHPDTKPINEVLPFIDAHLSEYDALFACSDEIDIIQSLQEYYGEKLIIYPSKTRSSKCDFQMPRSTDEKYTHAFRYNAIINWSKQNMGYQIGEDAISEVYLMSSVNTLLCTCNSNVNYFVRIINPQLPYYIYHIPHL